MPELIVIEPQAGNLRRSWSMKARARVRLQEFLRSRSFESAQSLCSTVIPTSEFYASQCFSDGHWTATIRFDNLLHDGEGDSEVAALLDAIRQITQAIDT